MNKSSIWCFAVAATTTVMAGGTARAVEEQAEIRVFNDFSLPLEPAILFSMSEYNLSLCLFSSLFSLDDASMPKSDILESWKFDDRAKAYDLVIREGVVWSDGVPFSSDDIAFSITRLENVSKHNFQAIQTLLNGKASSPVAAGSAFEIVSPRQLRVRVHSVTPELFSRLAAVFVPMVRKDLVDQSSLRVSRHDVTLAPYVVDSRKSTPKMLWMSRNDRFFRTSKDGAATIAMRPYDGLVPRIGELGKSGTWQNLALDRAFITKEEWNAIRDQHGSLWTRPIDRVLYIYPTKSGLKRGGLATVLQALGSALRKDPIDFSEFPGLQAAASLQPPGFVLSASLDYPVLAMPNNGGKQFRIAVINQQTPVSFLQREFEKRGLLASYEAFPVTRLKELQAASEYDFLISSFGAADPDPVTWLNLVLGNDYFFIADYDYKVRDQFDQIKGINDQESRHVKLREMLKRAGEDGLYLPLAHFSSIAASDASLALSKIRPSDETVDLSRVVVHRQIRQ
jgi:MarR-like DNA-binding transcriptional regulator SgrR of sgrS sRNA